MRFTNGLFVLFLVLALAAASTAGVIKFDNSTDAGFNLVNENSAGVTVSYVIDRMTIDDFIVDGKTMQIVSIPGVFLPDDEGAPNLPRIGRFIAMPEGARAEFRIVSTEIEILDNIDLAPAPPIRPENDDSPLPYVKDPVIYSNNAFYPENPVVLSDPSEIRGVDYVAVGITPFQYNPVTRQLKVYRDIEVQVDFIGGNGHFGEDRLRNRFWEPILSGNLINYKSLPAIDFGSRTTGNSDNEDFEYIIFVPDNPDLEAWADTIRHWRTLQGIRTCVVPLSEVGGNNATSIKQYIMDAYNNWNIPPVAVLLFSDFENSGDDYGITAPEYHYSWNSCRSDNYYADMNYDHLPDLAISRMCVQGYDHAETMVGKMLEYERTPPTSFSFYDNPLVAGGWQTDRWFILCTEIVYGYYENILHRHPVREYAIFDGQPGGVWSTNSNTNLVVDYFGPNGLGYIPSSPMHLVDWGGNAEGISEAINGGAFLVLHRDHGEEDGWSCPGFHNEDLVLLNNAYLPFVMSINCLTGKFNYEEECFAEAFQRYRPRALGMLAASDVSFSFVNDTYVWGTFDGLWSDFDPGYGNDDGELLRTCFANAYGKYYLEASSWPSNGDAKAYTYYLMHHHGDPFLTIYSWIPRRLDVIHDPVLANNATEFIVTANEGSFVALTVNGEIIGTAEGTGSPVAIQIEPQMPGEIMLLTATKPNYYRYTAEIPVIPVAGFGLVWGRVIDSTSGAGLPATVTYVNTQPEFTVSCQPSGEYEMFIPCETRCRLRAFYNSDYVADAANIVMQENDTVEVNFELFPTPVAVEMLHDDSLIYVEQGGSFDYIGVLENITGQRQNVDVWVWLHTPECGFYGTLKRFNNIGLDPYQQIVAWGIVQEVPEYAPPGTYRYYAVAGEYDRPYTCDSLQFMVVPGPGGNSRGWNLCGWFDGGDMESMPRKIALYSNYPNPFNASTTISFDLPRRDQVDAEIFNIMGQKVETLWNGRMNAGNQALKWDATNYSSGIYFFKLTVGDQVRSRRMTLIK